MTSPADPFIAALRANHDVLATLVKNLDHDALTGPSADTEWDISQVLSHLGSGAEITLNGLRSSLDPSIEAAPNPEIWDRWNAMSPEDRLTGFLAANEALVSAYEGLDDAIRNEIRVDMGFLPEPVGLEVPVQFRLNEAALHSWDVRWSLDPAATLTETEAALLIDQTVFMLGWIGHADALSSPVTLVVTTTGPDLSFGLSIADAVTVVDVPDDAAGTLTLPAEAWIRLATGRLTAPRTPPSVRLESAEVDLDDLRAVFPGY